MGDENNHEPIQLKDYTRHGCGTRSFNALKDQANLALDLQSLLWDAYNVLDHGTQEDRLLMLEDLKQHFKKVLPVPPKGPGPRLIKFF
ncbi:hypothetical protein Phi2_0068 [Vibrio phage phi 2]|uniref:hypothetical protein n=1 Tax=Vibrio phage X29 TaxID=1500713 RepID=UPI00045FE3CA|nr:hypothetical protein SBVcX29_0001 [Vibrio phage X29]AHN84877.1 hypothetical protein Phi2_0068 [Vibrio phage phi 2]AIA10280.1 hypothetical protein SBVcX29_0001 [Vibrio phage X29]